MKNNKKRKKKQKSTNKFKYIKYCIITIIAVLLAVGIYLFLTAPDDKTSLTILEKQWIMKNKKTLIDINVPNNINVLAAEGEGVLFDYLEFLEDDTELEFNKTSYNYPEGNDFENLSIMILENDDKLKENDILITEDNYVLVSKKEGNYGNLDNVYNKKIGVLKNNKKIITDSIGTGYTYVESASLTDIVKSLNENKIEYAILPRYYALEEIVVNKLYVNYTFNNLTNKIVLRTSDNKKLNSIMEKYLMNYKMEEYMENYEEAFMKFYLKNTEATDLDTSSLSRKVYKYGYVKDSTYNIKDSKKMYGYAGEYINLLSNMADIELEYKEYENTEKLKDAIKNGEVDVAFIDFEYQNENGNYTIEALNPRMIALSKKNYPITEKEGLQNRKLYTLKNTYLESYLKDNYNSVLTSVKKASATIPEDGILVLDEIDYYYYISKEQLGEYYTLLKDDYNAHYRFYVSSDEKVMYDCLNFVLMYADSNDLKLTSINNLIETNASEGGFKNLYLLIVTIIIVPIIVLFMLIALTKARKNTKLLRKEDVLKYNDMLTSLKNRNYLNANIDDWDEMKINPRTVIIADLNNLKYVNDNYGQEEGNILIKKAAAILINTQLEKSEIIRTDGNEFLIYLIGYNKTQVNTYINKLSREFEKLPHGFGAAIGYSMIEDEIKTIDDAINEASIEMRMDKEQNYK